MRSFGNTLLSGLLLLHCSWRVAAEPPQNPYFVSPPGYSPEEDVQPPIKGLGEHEFTLRHIYHHGSHLYPQLHRYLDIPKDAPLTLLSEDGQAKQAAPKTLRAKGVPKKIQRLADRRQSTMAEILQHGRMYGQPMPLPASAWTIDDVAGPNHTDKETVLTLARMAANAYVDEPWTGDWQDVGGGMNLTEPFGWEWDGLRGHIYGNEDNSTIVIGLKGTSGALWDGAGTTTKDKINDNLFASCCCGQGGSYQWRQVCSCKSDDGFSCNSTCIRTELNTQDHYYSAVNELYHNITERYPTSNVWVSGHSLGGVVSSLLGLTHGLPTVTFEAYPDALAASRLGLPVPPGYRIGAHQSRTDTSIHHFGHTADPVFMGTCTGVGQICQWGGYAMESQCHTGERCVYDTVSDRNWRVGIGYHKILYVISDVLESYDEVASCEPRPDCTDCYKWKFFESNGTEKSTTTTSKPKTTTTTYTRTRTETCKTPGWWGCLDETTTTTTHTSTRSSSSSSSTTCKTPGWFGCRDETTTTRTSASPAPTIVTTTVTTTTSLHTSSTTCETPGYFYGCYDPTTSTPKPSSPISQSTPSATRTSSSSPSPTQLPTTRRKCASRHWYGLCKEWKREDIEPKIDL